MTITGNQLNKRPRGSICCIYDYGAAEKVPSISRKAGVLVDKSLLSTKTAKFPLSIVNLGDEPVTLHKGPTVALLRVHSVTEIGEKRNTEEVDFFFFLGGGGRAMREKCLSI